MSTQLSPDALERARLQLENAERAEPFCRECARATIIVERHGQLWLECRRLSEGGSFLERLADLMVPHTRQQVTDLEFTRAA